MTWTVTVEQDEDGSLVVPIPDELLAQLGVGIGDSLYLIEEYVGTAHCIALSKTPKIPDRVDSLVKHWDNEGKGHRHRNLLSPARVNETVIDDVQRRAEINFEFAGLPFKLLITPRVKVSGLDFGFVVTPVGHAEARRQACRLLAMELLMNKPPEVTAVIEQLRALYPDHLSY